MHPFFNAPLPALAGGGAFSRFQVESSYAQNR
nr:MAG TPA: hypothetical protein [Caudoviricetes sp.]